MSNKTFPSRVERRAVAMGVLIVALGFASWVDVREARAIVIRPVPIRPAAPAYKPIFLQHPTAGSLLELAKPKPDISFESLGLGKGLATEAKPLSRHEAYGFDVKTWMRLNDEARLRFVEALAKPVAPEPAQPTVNRSATLHDWYPPAADLAQRRPQWATYQAQRAVESYQSFVGDSEFTHLTQAAGFNQRAREDSQQLAVRLLHAAFEDAPEPSPFGPAVSTAEVKQDLMNALNSTAAMSGRPVGTRVWGDLLMQEFPPAVYQWRGRTIASGSGGMVRYRVDSPLLPSTVTSIDFDALARAAAKRYETRRNALGLKFPTTTRSPFIEWPLWAPAEFK